MRRPKERGKRKGTRDTCKESRAAVPSAAAATCTRYGALKCGQSASCCKCVLHIRPQRSTEEEFKIFY